MITVFPQIVDVKTAYLLTQDFTRRHFPLVPFKRLLTTPQELDDVHNEIVETAKRWADPITVRAFASPDEVTQPMKTFGVENLRACTLLIAVPDLVAAGLAEQDPTTFVVTLKCGLGDRFEYSGQDYSILEFVPGHRWANTDIILYFLARAELYRTTSAGLL